MAEFDSITLTEIGYRFKHNLQGTIDWCRPGSDQEPPYILTCGLRITTWTRLGTTTVQ